MDNRNKIITGLAIAAVIALSFYLYSKNKTDDMTNWLTFNDSVKEISFKYPAEIDAKYITAVDWPPQTNVVAGEFTCIEVGDEITPDGKTSEQTIDGNKYCTNKVSEGAAGSIYTSYAYARKIDNKVVILAFSLRFVQCANYEEPKKTECENERAAFNIDNVVGTIFDTVKLN